MPSVLRMPGVAAQDTSAVLAEWLVAERDDVTVAQPIATVETEKAVVDVEAEEAGVVLRMLVAAGASVDVGDPIAVLGAPGEHVDDVTSLLHDLGISDDAAPAHAPEPSTREVPEPPPVDPGSGAPVDEQPVPDLTPPPPGGDADSGAGVGVDSAAAHGRVFASPLARRLARDAGLDLDRLAGTGPGGRVLRRDVERAIAEPAAVAAADPATAVPAAPAPSAPGAGVQEIPHTRLRRAIAARLVESKQQAPHFYLRATVRADALLALRAELAAGEVAVSLNDLVLKAVAAAHERVPEMNVVWGFDAVRAFETCDVAVAVATDRGLVTPVVRDVSALRVAEVAARVRDLADRARAGRLRQDELEGGSITVSNLGMYGVEEFAAIINPPHAAILAVGAVREEPVVQDGAVVVGRVLHLTVSVDHRPVDGTVAARWLGALVDLLEHPARALA